MSLLFGYSSGLEAIEEDTDMNGNRIIDLPSPTIQNPLRRATPTRTTLEEVDSKDRKETRAIQVHRDHKDLKAIQVHKDHKDLKVTPVCEVRKVTLDHKV